MPKLEINKIYQGDCLEIMKGIDDKSIDMILCDLPYGTTACKWDTIIPFEPLWKQYKRIIKDNGAIVLTASQPFTTELINSNRGWYRYSWYWQKERGTNISSAKYQPMRVIEDILIFGGNSVKYKPIMKKVKNYSHVLPLPKKNHTQQMDSKSIDEGGNRIIKNYNEAYPTNLLPFSRENMVAGKSFHPTQKPVALFEYLIKTYTNEGDIVLDNCAGSGTTGVACENLKRNFILIEKEPKYVEICRQRLRQGILL